MIPVTVTVSISFHEALNAVCHAVEASSDPGYEFVMGDADRLESVARDIRQSITEREERLKQVADAQYAHEKTQCSGSRMP
jgi:hypothetical protein